MFIGRSQRGAASLRIVRAVALVSALALSAASGAALAAGSAPAAPEQLVADPAVGGPSTIVQILHYVAGPGAAGEYDGDTLQVTGPTGTRCAGNLLIRNINGPRQDGSGPATLYIGPGAEEEYPAMVDNTAYDPWAGGKARLTRWCPGTYMGEITRPVSLPVLVTAAFQFRISATKHVKAPPPPTVARRLRPVTVSPDQGRRGMIFAVRYDAEGAGYNRGDVVEVDGPKRSACSGGLVRQLSVRPDWRAGALTLHIGPGADHNDRWASDRTTASPAPDDGTGAPLRRWCPGAYNGTILHEDYTKFAVIARFALHVAP